MRQVLTLIGMLLVLMAGSVAAAEMGIPATTAARDGYLIRRPPKASI
ncbi:MAG: hypothetical protein R2864_08670 [Syntrophotaleaceae bacterium]